MKVYIYVHVYSDETRVPSDVEFQRMRTKETAINTIIAAALRLAGLRKTMETDPKFENLGEPRTRILRWGEWVQ